MKKITSKILTLPKGDKAWAISTLVIAEHFGRRHANVLRSIYSLIESGHLGELEIEFCGRINELGLKNKYKHYILSERDFLIACPFIGGDKARDGQVIVVDEFLRMKEALNDQRTWKLERSALRLEYPGMTEAIMNAYDDPKPSDYARENNMIYRVLFGRTAKEFCEHHDVKEVRDALSEIEVARLKKAQRLNTSMIEMGMSYHDRKAKLTEMFRVKVLGGKT